MIELARDDRTSSPFSSGGRGTNVVRALREVLGAVEVPVPPRYWELSRIFENRDIPFSMRAAARDEMSAILQMATG